jgi:hypothetical protein
MTKARMAFLFLDECSSEKLDLAALTGVLVELDSYVIVRDAMCQLVVDIQAPEPHTWCAPIELHGRSLLQSMSTQGTSFTDEHRLAVFSGVVRIVNENNLRVFRVAYLNRKEIAQSIKADPNLYSLNFFGIQTVLQQTLATTLVLPVMDGIPSCLPNATKAPRFDPQLIRAFASSVRSIHHMRRHARLAESLSIENAYNLAEPVFADSSHSTLLQLVDLVSYLLHQIEREELESAPKKGFRAAVLAIAKQFDPALLHCWSGRMKTYQSLH